LGGGYTAFGDEQIFLNVTNSEGELYSGLDDATFQGGLKRALPHPLVRVTKTAESKGWNRDE
jgi:hypothetical protein